MLDLTILLWGLAGALLRYILSIKLNTPWITTIINIISILIISLIIKYDLGLHLLAFNSAFSTLSTYNYELITRFKKAKSASIKYFLINIVGSVLIFIIIINL